MSHWLSKCWVQCWLTWFNLSISVQLYLEDCVNLLYHREIRFIKNFRSYAFMMLAIFFLQLCVFSAYWLLRAFLTEFEQDPCVLPIDEGHTCKSGTAMSMYGFNPASQKCEEFEYKGCGGNGNNFVEKHECWSTCASKQRWPFLHLEFVFFFYHYENTIQTLYGFSWR